MTASLLNSEATFLLILVNAALFEITRLLDLSALFRRRCWGVNPASLYRLLSSQAFLLELCPAKISRIREFLLKMSGRDSRPLLWASFRPWSLFWLFNGHSVLCTAHCGFFWAPCPLDDYNGSLKTSIHLTKGHRDYPNCNRRGNGQNGGTWGKKDVHRDSLSPRDDSDVIYSGRKWQNL